MDLHLSDFDTFSESSCSENQDDVEFLYGGHAFSILSSLEDTIGKIDDFLYFERGFIRGDIVCSVKNPSGQMGKVIDVGITVDLENIHGSKMRDVNSKFLKRIRSVSVGDYVVNGAWLGKVQKIVDRIIVLFDDGKKSEFSTMGPEKLVPISPDLLEDSEYPFYPGQRVQVDSSSVPKSTRWLCGVKKDIKNQGTVCFVDAELVYVDWLGCEMVEAKISTPPCLQDFKDLTLLPCLAHANWQLGDWCVCPVTDRKTPKQNSFLTAPACGLIEGEEKPERIFQRGNLVPNFQEISVITKTKTKVDVVWQDGSHSVGLDSNSLLPVSIVDAHDFWPEQFVLEKGMCDDSSVPSFQRWGIVKSVDAKERTVKVKWSAVSVDQPTNIKLEQMEEIVSAYELVEHPDYSYSLGDVVFMLQKCHFANHSYEKGFKNLLISKWGASTWTETVDKYTSNCNNLNKLVCNSFLSCIGIVVGFRDGDVEVRWASGDTNKVAPYEIYRVDKCDGLSARVMPYNEHVEPSDEVMTVLGNQSSEKRGKDYSGSKYHGEECEYKLKNSSSSSFPQAAIELFTSISSTLFGSWGSLLFGACRALSEDEEETVTSNQEEVLELCDMHPVGTPVNVGHLETTEETKSEQNIKEVEKEQDCALPSSSKLPEIFRRFDMVSDCSDHHFVGAAGKGQQSSQMKRAWLKKVQQEWSILEKDLPETVFVRVYEERMDLLRAVVVGAPGTPYHDGLFFFDIFLPPEYPCEPPMVSYNSSGLRVNPNLYESGKVCLSLLNTWSGSRSEVWNPENSTILQILLSLQALVLNEKPYFNEAGYDLQIGKVEGEKNSVSYNENAFLVNCKSMLYLLRKPPKHFEAVVQEHFSQRYKHILLACKAYTEGAPVGSAFGNENIEQENKIESSMGFKIMLAKLFPKLVEAFSDKGMDCSDVLNEGE
ncbi:hypothetical protein ACH5RR_015109 [Cinchona calisaya]|uniref:E2 ubiquitin-conjugating enzyme n=1 Tax=Cinchona calisaya TaxID=153742 RepID=A0ABD2ZS59_9GENT